jgi:hypothetical protein
LKLMRIFSAGKIFRAACLTEGEISDGDIKL